MAFMVPMPVFNVPCAPMCVIPQPPCVTPQPHGVIPQPPCGYQQSGNPCGGPRLPRSWANALELPPDARLGSGSFATLFTVRHKTTGEKFALKVMERQFFTMRDMEPQLNMEIEAMKKISSSGRTNHVAKLFDLAEENGLIFLRMELCQFNLEAHALRQPYRRIPERDLVPWAQQLCCGLQEIHSLGIAHRDIKPTNLLIAPDGKLKIIDFGWCAFIADLRRSKAALAGTFEFMAPEILEDRPHTESVDLWSSGACLLELLTGQPLITTVKHPTGQSANCPRQAAKIRTTRALTEIKQKCPLPQHGRPSFLSPQCWAFCQALLMPQVSSRMSLQGAMNHPWILGVQGTTSWTPAPIAANATRHPVKQDHHSWDGSTTASSSGSGHFPIHGTTNMIIAPTHQVVDSKKVYNPFVRQASFQPRVPLSFQPPPFIRQASFQPRLPFIPTPVHRK